MSKYKLVCKTTFSDIAVQIILWALLTLITAGLAAPFFIYYMVRMLINNTEMHKLEETMPPPPH